ncbi:MAG: MFS transporter [Theionarchaea archaeon]|nr:MFS transporter [Theionarchaea archaeon]
MKWNLKVWQLFVLLSTSVFYFFYYFARYNYSITLPYIQEELQLSHAVLGLIATALTAGYALGQFVNGFLIDRYGPRVMMTLGGFLSAFANFFMGIGQSFYHLVAAWFSNGYFQAMGFGSCCKLYVNWFDKENRGKPLGFNEFLQSFSSAIIIPFGALIITVLGWRYVYVIPVLPLLFFSLFFYWKMRNKPIEKGFEVAWAEEEVQESFLEHAKQAYRMALSDWRMLLTYASYGGSQFARFAIYTWVPVYIYDMTGQIVESAWVTAFFAIGGAVGSLAIGFLTDLIHKRYPLIFAGMTLSAICLVVFASMPSAPILILSGLMALCGVGIEAVEVCYFLLPLDILDKDKKATGVGCMNAWGKTFASFQGGLFGLIVDLSGFQIAFLVTALISFISAFIVIPIKK